MTKYIIGTLSELDTPLSPSALGNRSFKCFRNGLTEERLQKERDELLGCSPEAIHSLSAYIRDALKDENICVIGTQSKVEANKVIFGEIENLI